MKSNFYTQLIEKSKEEKSVSDKDCKEILESDLIDIKSLLDAAFTVRKHFIGETIKIHIINNVQNGLCSEDCHYCAQSKTSKASINEYPMKSDDQILLEAKQAYEKGAFRYCMVFAGKGSSEQRIEKLTKIIKQIKNLYNLEVCVSPGVVNQKGLDMLKAAGLNRLNHNINTSSKHYSKICTSHKFQDRIDTLYAAKKTGLQICSGVIIGMGESSEDIVEMASILNDLKIESIPVNFFMPIEGLALDAKPNLTPEYCLRVLCLFRFLCPKAEIRVAAGREMYLKDKQHLAFYPANSLFMEGYLNVSGDTQKKTLTMLKDAGFKIESDKTLEELLK
ncbi:MAG: biotin synthase BioB [Candidatus Zapsychrus exili]|nr:biotin synthase BioB [Candidatus Zapsychrus exili]